ncbi:MAG: ftsH [Parachlamydiales bacterium]|nr:ftsH [Parachlamydiales bacterium]
MANDNKFRPDAKRSFPGGFVIFLLAAIVIMFVIQTISSDGSAKVSFSHQVEHLINLNLTVPEDNRKIAQNENLVTFSGKFRESLSEDSRDRFHYLELLNRQHQLGINQKQLLSDLDGLQKSVRDSADLFLHLYGQPLPRGGYAIIGALYDTPGRENSIVIRSLTERDLVNLALVQRMMTIAQQNIAEENALELGKDMRALVALLRSPALGIGVESMKLDLKNIDKKLSSATDMPIDQQMAVYRSALPQIVALFQDLNRERDGVRLMALRSVRSYHEELQKFNTVAQELGENEALLDKARQKVASVIWYFNNQELSTRALEKQDPEAFGHWFASAKQEWDHFPSNQGLTYRAPDQPRNTVLERTFQSQEPAPNYVGYLITILPALLIFVFLYILFTRQMKGAGSSAMNFGKSPARLMTRENNKVMFKDVAGCEEAKEELKEIVDFLKDPQKFTALGARIPKGVLLVGPPGTGKTLIARAVAGEADRPFYSISGSDFVEMFVGVGASRIRDLFDQAKKNAPCIIFMDEIDAVGRHRGAGIGGGHDEREQTLNQLLVEMDGFDTREGVILMAATNRPDVLDRALLRPGRFDRRVILDLPDVKGRLEILKVHARKIKIDASVDLNDIARSTPGASGADLENILNEAALLAARMGRSAVTSVEAKEACDKVRYGKERRSMEIGDAEKKTTAFHESGHAMVGLVVEHSDPVDKVTIIPRGYSLGATHFMPTKNRLSYWKKEAIDQLAVCMGGRAAEEIFVGDMSSGAQHDIAQATKMARSMVCEWGMSDLLGTVSYDERTESGQYLGMTNYHDKSYSEETAKKIDAEVRQLIDAAHQRAREIIEQNRVKVQLMADMLMEFETLDSNDIKKIMDDTWDADGKRQRLKDADDLQRKQPPPPPVPVQSTITPAPSKTESRNDLPGIQPG